MTDSSSIWGPLVDKTLLLRIRKPTLTKLGNQLNTERQLMSEPEPDSQMEFSRDWRGLADFSNIHDNSDLSLRVQTSSNKAGEIVKIWCTRPGVMVKNLLEALDTIDRFDVIEELAVCIKADCAYAEKTSAPEDHQTITTNNIITVQVMN